MAVYQGFRLPSYVRVTKDGAAFLPAASLKLWSHSPDGFEWGFQGSGPAQLALALLLDVLKSEEAAVKYHQRFKREVVACFEQAHWVCTSEGIRRWVARVIATEVGSDA